MEKIKIADIKLGYACNDKCVHCVVEKLREEALKNKTLDLNTKEYYEKIQEAKKKGTKIITVTGGEPTIRKDILKILKFIKSLKLKIHLQSNGKKLSQKEFFFKINSYVDIYEIALHGNTANLHDKITQVKGSFNQTIAGIKNIVSINKKNYGKIVLSKLNYMKLKETLILYQKLGVNCVVVAFAHSNGKKEFLEKIIPRYKNIKICVEDSLNYFKDNSDFLITFENILPCALDKEYNLIHFSDFFENLKIVDLSILGKKTQNWNYIINLI